HDHEIVRPAHGAVALDALADVAGGPHELGLRVAHVEPVALARPQVTQHSPAGERVVDVAAHGRRVGPHQRTPTGAAPPGPRGATTSHPCMILCSIYRLDISATSRTPVDHLVFAGWPPVVRQECTDARDRRSWVAARAAAPRLRAEEALGRDARVPLGRVV